MVDTGPKTQKPAPCDPSTLCKVCNEKSGPIYSLDYIYLGVNSTAFSWFLCFECVDAMKAEDWAGLDRRHKARRRTLELP